MSNNSLQTTTAQPAKPDDSYNGWTNRETWACTLHMDNSEVLYKLRQLWCESARLDCTEDWQKPAGLVARQLQTYVEDIENTVFFEPAMATTDQRNMIADIGSTWRIDYHEIARNWLEE